MAKTPRRSFTLLAAAAALLLTAACEGYGPKQTIGGLGAAAGGGLLGSMIGSGTGQLAAVAAGTLLGALVGSEVGRSMDELDWANAESAQRQAVAAPVGQTIAWQNPQSGNSGAVTPMRDGATGSGQYCREFQQTVVVGGRVHESFGVACRQPDGSWQFI